MPSLQYHSSSKLQSAGSHFSDGLAAAAGPGVRGQHDGAVRQQRAACHEPQALGPAGLPAESDSAEQGPVNPAAWYRFSRSLSAGLGTKGCGGWLGGGGGGVLAGKASPQSELAMMGAA